jgi:hypothetical protein
MWLVQHLSNFVRRQHPNNHSHFNPFLPYKPRPKMFTTFDTFPLFTAFPKDIRLLIWEFSLPEPRIVHVKQAETRIGKVEHDGYYEPAWVMRSYSPIPSLLHVDIEAREVASRFYKPAFQCSFPLSEDAPYIWFDFNRDYFYLTKDTFQDLHGHACYLISASSGIGDLPKADICRIRNLAVDSKMWGRLHNVRSLANILYRLGGVENLTICTDHATSDGYEPPTDDTSTTLWDLRSWDAHGDVQVDVRRCFKKYDLKEDELHPSLARERIPVVKYEKIDLKDLISIVKDVGLRCETTSDSGTGGIIVDEVFSTVFPNALSLLIRYL